MNILVVEDDIIVREGLKSVIAQQQHNVIACGDTDTAVEILNKENIDLVFLDIDLGEGRNGVWLAKFLNNYFNIPFIYTTGNDDRYTIKKAIETNPLSYLIKPFTEKDIFVAIEMVNTRGTSTQRAIQKNNEFFIKDRGVLKKIFWDSVLYIDKIYENDCKIFTSQSTEYVKNIFDDIEGNLPDYFVQTNQRTFVNFNKILQINNEIIELLDGFFIPLDDAYKDSILKKLNTFS